MKHHVRKLQQNRKVRYLVVGGSCFAVEYAVFAFLLAADAHLLVANSISFLAGLFLSFWLHKQWSFAGDHKMQTGKQFVSYAILAGCNLILTNVIISFLVEAANVEELIAKVLTMFMIVIWNFLFMSRFIFKEAELN